MRRVAKRISQTSAKSFGMYDKASRLAGEDLIHLEVGRPHADTPAHIKQATIAALDAGKVHYSDPRGTLELRETLAAKLTRQNGIKAGPQDVLVTNGVTHAAFVAFMAMFDPGDEVILLQPHYPQHVGKIELAGAVPVFATLDANDNYTIHAAAIEARVTSRTRAIVLVNPSNPTGRVYSRAELQALAEVAIRHDLIVIADEVYEDIVYDGARHTSIAALDGMQDRTVTMFAFTKSYAMDGWRIGYLTAPQWLMPALLKIAMNDVTHINTFIQDAPAPRSKDRKPCSKGLSRKTAASATSWCVRSTRCPACAARCRKARSMPFPISARPASRRRNSPTGSCGRPMWWWKRAASTARPAKVICASASARNRASGWKKE